MFIGYKTLNKYLIILFILITTVTNGYANTCVKDLNNDGIINEQTEKWDCLATDPPLCPQGLMNCATAGITLSGTANTKQTNIKDKIGITKITADAEGASLIIEGWSCSNVSCSSANIGSIKIKNATVSGTVAADKISRMVGNASAIQVYGCNGSTACTEQLLGSITIDGAAISGYAAADAGLVSIIAGNSTLSIAGMTCSGSGCYQTSAGTLSVTGLNAVCPAGAQYKCVDVSGIKKCSPLTCNDDTYGGKVTPGQKICIKDINGDGNIDFNTEMGICQQYNAKYYCPMQAKDCTKEDQAADPTCEAGGTLNTATKKCEIKVNDTYTCPADYTLGTGNLCISNPACPAGGTLNSSTNKCEAIATTAYTCPLAGSYNNLTDCNNNCSLVQTGTCTPNQITNSTLCIHPDFAYSYQFHYELDCWTGGYYMNNTSCPSGIVPCSGSGTTWGPVVYYVLLAPFTFDAPSYFFTYIQNQTTVTGTNYTCSLDGSTYSSSDACTTACNKNTPIACTGPAYFCPAGYTPGAGNLCNADPTCPAGGTFNGATGKCEAAAMTTESCPAGYTLSAPDTCNEDPICAQGTLNNDTMKCITGTAYACPFGSQYDCFPNVGSNNVMQCNNLPCIDGSTQNPANNQSDPASLHDDGTKDDTGHCLGTIYLFNGKPLSCRPAGINTNFFNCCDQAEGSFLFIKKFCGEPDTECVTKAATGSCHFVGDYCKTKWPLFGCVQKANVFCCFSSMLARIIHEQGRPQLQSFNGWGSAEAPDCRGFTVEEFSHLDFSQIDFSEYINATKTKMQGQMQAAKDKMTQQNTNSIQQKVQNAQ